MQSHDMSMERGGAKKYLSLLGVALLSLGMAACSFMSKEKPLVPLALEPGVKPQAVTLTEQGTQAYQSKQFNDAKSYFSQAVAEAPQSGPAHYNFALALNNVGETEQARQHFMEAANYAPGDKVIWDSPALRPYGNPEGPKKFKPLGPGPNRPGMGSGPR